jgi:uncharacterized protein YjiS (DUF1127 family)
MEMNMSILARIREARVRRTTTRELRAMPPELLRDIGIEPDNIESAVTGVIAQRSATRPHARGFHDRPLTGPSVSNGAWPYPWRHAG